MNAGASLRSCNIVKDRLTSCPAQRVCGDAAKPEMLLNCVNDLLAAKAVLDGQKRLLESTSTG